MKFLAQISINSVLSIVRTVLVLFDRLITVFLDWYETR